MTGDEKLLGYLKRVTAELGQTRQRLHDLREAAAEPVAIVGMACRFPGGVATPEAFWRMIAERVEVAPSFPVDRGWDDPGGRSGGVPGGTFLTDAAGFDAEFFGISPREAQAMDPQQRIMLELAWEAVERAGIDPAALRGSSTGVFSGAVHAGYGERLATVPRDVAGYLVTGGTSSVISGRVAYVLGLSGPAITIDTACSSSLVALHLAVRALRTRECATALAGGVTVMATPDPFLELGRQGALSPDGRTKPFASAADGTTLGEGAGVLVLQRLSDALADRHPVLAVIRGSAVNSDGASNGLTAPNGTAQEEVIRLALAASGLASAEVDAVEAHGTGTELGDPIEAQALLAAYGQDRREPLWLGSVKSNIGHPQAASGMAGVIKVVLALRHGVLPAGVNVDEPSRHVDWSTGNVRLLTGAVPWPDAGRPRRAGVSSFGLSGTNAHVILEQAPPAGPSDVGPSPAALPWVLSAHTGAALRARAGDLLDFLDAHPSASAADIASALATSRAVLRHRTVVVGADRDALVAGLRAVSRGADPTAAVTGRPRVILVFPGQGTQWPGMAADLLDTCPVFAERMRACADALRPLVGWELLDVVRGDIDGVEVLQPVLWSVMVSLAAVWTASGVRPDAVVGHSQGEVAAACAAGALSLADGARVVVARSRAVAAKLSGHGGMLAVSLPEEEARAYLVGGPVIAAVNGPRDVVLSGDRDRLDALAERLTEDGVRHRWLPIDHASHSPAVEAVKDVLTADLVGLAPRSSDVPFHSSVTGDPLDTREADGGYWYRNLRLPVLFDRAARGAADGADVVFVEVGPHPVLSAALEHLGPVVGTLRRDDGGPDRLLRSLADAFVLGVPVDWAAVCAWLGVRPGAHVDLPTYPFQRRHHWLVGSGAAPGQAGGHPLLGAPVALADSGTTVVTGRLSLAAQPWLADHAIGDTALLPGTAFVDLVLHAAGRLGCDRIEELTLHQPLALPPDGTVELQVTVAGPDEGGRRAVTVHARTDGTAWNRHAVAVTTTAAADADDHLTGSWPPEGAVPVDVEDVHDLLADAGYSYGPAFQGLRAAWRRGEEVFAEVEPPAEIADDTDRFGLHPALLDAALHAATTGTTGSGSVSLPFAWSGVTLRAAGASALRVRIVPVGRDAVALTAFGPEGAPVLSVDSVVRLPVPVERLSAPRSGGLFQVNWTALPEHLQSTEDTESAEIRWAAPGSGGVVGPDPIPDIVLLPVTSSGEPGPSAVRDTVRQALDSVRAWVSDDRLAAARLVLVTRGAVAAGGREPTDLAAAAVWGLVRSARAEHPDRLALLDVEDDGPVPALAAALAAGETEFAVRGGRLLVPRLAALSAPIAGGPDWGVGTVLVTGGTGVLGRVVAAHLLRGHGVRRVVLAGRRGVGAPGVGGLCAEWGGRVVVVECDVADRGAVARLVGGIGDLTGVVHAAGVLDDGVVGGLTAERVGAVLRPKVDGAWHLHELTRDRDLAQFVLFSSAAGVLGGPGQAAYAAANTFLDALAQSRHAQGMPARSLPWGLWAERSGMTDALGEVDVARMAETGVVGLGTAESLALFDLACAADEPVLLPIGLDLTAWQGAAPPLLHGLVGGPIKPGTRRSAAARLRRRLLDSTEDDRDRLLVDLVRTQAAAVLKHPTPVALDTDRAFRELGFDSLTGIELRNRLAEATGLRLPPTLVFDWPTTVALAGRLKDELLERDVAAVPVIARAEDDDPVVVVAMSCRLPGGVTTPEELWRLLDQGVDALSPFPCDRGWDLRDSTVPPRGGFLDDVAGFDADLFSVSPREALAMDPQQRLLLEGAWEVLERAGIDPLSLRGSRTGVFAGIMHSGYGYGSGRVPDDVLAYLGTGNAAGIASGRIAYVLGLEGPVLSVDTACSSSLVALHLAAQAIRRGECSLALAGGATVLCTPDPLVDFHRQRNLAPDGRCKAFSADADGTVLAEGVGLVLLERLSVARGAGRRVLGVVRGSAVGSDGASNGLTAPSGRAQVRVIRAALADAGVAACEVDVVEAHGTGTRLGDPIELGALVEVYGPDREHPAMVGSVKSNVGHTQAAAGVVGVVKALLAMGEGVVPRTLHADRVTEAVDWSSGGVVVAGERCAWPEADRPRRMAVSSFGISGTNAHVVLEQAPRPPETEPPRDDTLPVVLWRLSGHTEPALRAQAARLKTFVDDNPDVHPADVAHTLHTGRAALTHRAVVLGRDRRALVTGLTSLAEGEASGGVVRGRELPGGLAVLCTGQGAQRAGMGRDLAAAFPVFARALDEVCALLDDDLREVMSADDDPRLHSTLFAQQALFAFEVAAFRLLESHGLAPSHLLGHSVGEVAAAHLAGVLDLPDACALVTARSRLMGTLAPNGAMASITATEAELGEALPPGAVLAAVNGPESVVVSGTADAVAAVVARFAAAGRRTKALATEVAFHSPLVEPALAEFGARIRDLRFSEPRIPLVSTVTGRPAGAEILLPDYWVRQVREPVRFRAGVLALAEQGVATFVEVGPDAVLSAMAGDCLPDHDPATFIPVAQRTAPAVDQAITALARLHARGVPVRLPVGSGRFVDLPTYPFQHRRYWLDDKGGGPLMPGAADAGHPWLDAVLRPAGTGDLLCTGRLSTTTHPWLADHAPGGVVLVPGAAFVELAVRAGALAGAPVVEELLLDEPLALTGHGSVHLQVAVAAPDGFGCRVLTVHSRPADAAEDEPWTRHATGVLGATATGPGDAPAMPGPRARPLDLLDAYDRLAEAGYEYGPAFRALRAVWREGDDLLAEITLPDPARGGRFTLHPVLLDAALHAAALDRPGRELSVPFAWTGVTSWARAGDTVLVRLSPTGPDAVAIQVTDPSGTPVLSVAELVSRPLRAPGARVPPNSLFRLDWSTHTPPTTVPAGDRFAVVGADRLGLADALSGAGVDVRRCADFAAVRAGAPGTLLVPVVAPSDVDIPAAVHALTREVLTLLGSWSADDRLTDTRLVLVTRGAVDTPPDLPAAAVWGLVRTAQLEHPDRITLLDVEDVRCAADPAVLAASVGGEPELRAGRAGISTPRLVPVEPGVDTGGWDPDGTVLITGGTGALGLLVARHLALRRRAGRIVLAGRRGASAPGAAELRAELAGLGAEVEFAACDATDRDALASLVGSLTGGRPLTAVVHSAAVLDDSPLTACTSERLAAVLAPKVDAAWHLHELTADLDLTGFVLFSSAAGTLGSPGQAAYAAGNAFLDGLARHRAALGLPATSLAWGPWQDGVAAGATAADQARLDRGGIRRLSAEQGLALLDATRTRPEPVLVPLWFDRNTDPARVAPKLAPLVTSHPRPPTPAPHADALRRELAALSPAEREPAVARIVRAQVAAVLGRDDLDPIDSHRPFPDLGLDSLTAVELRNALGAATGLRLPPTAVFDHPNVTALARHLASALDVTDAPGPPAPANPLRDLFRTAVRSGRLHQGLDLLAAAAHIGRRTFAEPEDPPGAPVTNGPGTGRTSLFCLPSPMGLGGAYQLTRLASEFTDSWHTSVLPMPGFDPHEELPATPGALLRRFADHVVSAAAGEPFVLLGYCAGGVIGHAVAARLEARGVRPRAVVLLDSYQPDIRVDEAFWAQTLEILFEREEQFGPFTDYRLTGMGWYARIIESCPVRRLDTPTLLVRSDRWVVPLPSDAPGGGHGWRANWSAADEVVDVRANHFTMIEEAAEETARVVRAWLDRTVV